MSDDVVQDFQDTLTAKRVAARFAATQRTATINDTNTLEQLIDMEIESDGSGASVHDVPSKAMREVTQKAGRYDFAVETQLLKWCNKNMGKLNIGQGPLRSAKNEHDVVEVMMDLRGGAGYLYFMEAEGHGVGTWDGDWDVLFVDSRNTIKELSRLIESKTRSAYNALKDAIRDAAYEAAPDEDED